mmetsp:Transcript_17913/g.17228  ORF Transcript_17913/g.17228 Transcript_17913/m.17228 type:complete len:125 (+) Transcript_17913:112-486(+)
MRLITHNMLKCNIKGVENGYPLRIEVEKTEILPSDYDAALTISMLKKIQWKALRSAAIDLEMHDFDEFEEITEEMRNDDSLLRKIHHILFEVHLIEGHLVCPETSRKFPVKDGIPNMLLHEDEV